MGSPKPARGFLSSGVAERKESPPGRRNDRPVDHPLPAPPSAPDALVRPWRTATYVAVTVAAIELVLLVVIGGGALLRVVSHSLEHAAAQRALAPTVSTPPRHVPTKPRRAAPPAAKLTRSHVHVLVLNGNGRTGAAAAAAARVRRRGYEVGGVGNAPRHVARSMVMYRAGFAGEGRRLARDLGIRTVGPLDGLRRRELHGAQVVFVLGG